MKKLLLILIAIIYSTPIFAIGPTFTDQCGYKTGQFNGIGACATNHGSTLNGYNDCYFKPYSSGIGSTSGSCTWAGPGYYVEYTYDDEDTAESSTREKCTNAEKQFTLNGDKDTNFIIDDNSYNSSGGGKNDCGFTAQCAAKQFANSHTTLPTLYRYTSCEPIDTNTVKPNITQITYDGTYTITCNFTYECPSNSTPNSNQNACIANKGYYYTGKPLGPQGGCVTGINDNATKKCPTGTTTSGTGATTVDHCNVPLTGYCCTLSTCRDDVSKDCYEADYTITLDKNGGTDGTAYFLFKYNNTGGPYNTTGGTSITPPTKTGHDFNGYYIGNTQYIGSNGQLTATTRDNLRTYIENNSTLKKPTTKNPAITLTAKWTPRKYNVSYNIDGSFGVGPQVNYGAKFDLPTNITETGTNPPDDKILTHWTCDTDYGCNSKCTGTITQEMINNGDCEPTSGANGAMLVFKANWTDCTNGTVSSDATTCTCNTGYTPESWTNTAPDTCEPKTYTISVQTGPTTYKTTAVYKYDSGIDMKDGKGFQKKLNPPENPTKQEFDKYQVNRTDDISDEYGNLFIEYLNTLVEEVNKITITLSFKWKQYTVIYNNNGNVCKDTATYNTTYQIKSAETITNPCASFTYPGTTQSGKEFVGWKPDQHSKTFATGAVLPELDTKEYTDGNVTLSPVYADCSAGYYCTSNKKEPCPNGSTSDAGAKQIKDCYLSLSNDGTRIKDTKSAAENLNKLMTDSDNKIYYK